MAVQIYYQSIRDVVIDDQLLSMLQPQRRKQLFSFRFEDDKKRCAAAGLLLWEHLYHKHPEHFTVTYNATGKPAVFPPTVPYFNLSHSKDFVMLAISDTPVGCDIEHLHKAILTPHMFHQNELERLRALPEGMSRNREFLRLWTAKEAFLKAIGTGIDANAVTYDLSCGDSIRLADGSVWLFKHSTLPDSCKASCNPSSLSYNNSSQCVSEDFSEYLSCVCYKRLS